MEMGDQSLNADQLTNPVSTEPGGGGCSKRTQAPPLASTAGPTHKLMKGVELFV